MNRLRFWLLPALMCSFLWNSAFVCSQTKKKPADIKDPRLNQKVMVTVAGAELKTPTATVWKGYLGEVFTVTLTNGEWLWIGEKGGWLWEQQTIPLDASIELLTERIAKQQTAEHYHLRGVALLAHQKFEAAIADFTESLRLQPLNAGALNNRGQARYDTGDYKTAIQDFTAAIAIDAKNPLVLNNRALAYIELDDPANAMSDLQAALTLVPDYPEALNNRGVVRLQLNAFDEAIADFTAAIKIHSHYVDALENRAYAYVQKDEHTKALADLESAIQLNSQSYQAANDMAWLLATSPEASIRDTKRALELAKLACDLTKYQQWNTLDTLAVVYAENGQFAEAQKLLVAALKLAPGDEKVRIQNHLDLVASGKPVRD